jgi:hypothetical protein
MIGMPEKHTGIIMLQSQWPGGNSSNEFLHAGDAAGLACQLGLFCQHYWIG